MMLRSEGFADVTCEALRKSLRLEVFRQGTRNRTTFLEPLWYRSLHEKGNSDADDLSVLSFESKSFGDHLHVGEEVIDDCLGSVAVCDDQLGRISHADVDVEIHAEEVENPRQKIIDITERIRNQVLADGVCDGISRHHFARSQELAKHFGQRFRLDLEIRADLDVELLFSLSRQRSLDPSDEAIRVNSQRLSDGLYPLITHLKPMKCAFRNDGIVGRHVVLLDGNEQYIRIGYRKLLCNFSHILSSRRAK